MKGKVTGLLTALSTLLHTFRGPRVTQHPDPVLRNYQARPRTRMKRSRHWMIRHEHQVHALKAARGTPGKINFRRSDPRHGMYDPLRAAGLRVCWATPQGGVFVKDGEGNRLSPVQAFAAIRKRVPRYLDGAA